MSTTEFSLKAGKERRLAGGHAWAFRNEIELGGKDPGPGALVRVKTAKGRTTSSTKWLQRQLNDPYVARARSEGYRSRAAWKLVELDDKFHLLRPGMRVVDLGAAPGGWTQVAIERVAGGAVLGVDILPMDPIPGAQLMQLDFLAPQAEAAVIAAAGGAIDIVLSDMAASATGHQQTDHIRVIALAEAALEFAMKVLKPGGGFVAKFFQGGAEKDLQQRLQRAFSHVRYAKPPASRKDSAETYLVATGFRGGAGDV